MKLFETQTPKKGNIIIMCSSCECYYEVADKFNSRQCRVCNKSTTNDITGNLKYDLVKKKKNSHPRTFSSALKVANDISRLIEVEGEVDSLAFNLMTK